MDISDEIQKYRQEIKSERMDMSFGEKSICIKIGK